MASDSGDSTASAVVIRQPGASETLGIAWVHPEPAYSALVSERLILGRGESCQIKLQGSEVSRTHASIERIAAGWVINDEKSKNGIFVDGKRVQQAPLAPQTVVRIGEWVGVVCEQQDSPPVTGNGFSALAAGLFGGAALRPVVEMIQAAATSLVSVVLIGETGVGKDVFARTLHDASRRQGEFVAINCGALPEKLVEGELFGYRKGAFTGAERSHRGYVRASSGGTLFLDEVVDLDRPNQTKLLRVLEERAVVPIGETRPQPVDLRIVAAAQKPLDDAVERGVFRVDLMARLNGVEVHIPPLRKRREDAVGLFLAALQTEFSSEIPVLTAEVAERLCVHHWPLNVREVVQAAKHVAALHRDAERLELSHLPPRIAAPEACPANEAPEQSWQRVPGRAQRRKARIKEHDQEQLDQLVVVLRECEGKVSEAARRMGVSRQRIYRLLDQHPEMDAQRLNELSKGSG